MKYIRPYLEICSILMLISCNGPQNRGDTESSTENFSLATPPTITTLDSENIDVYVISDLGRVNDLLISDSTLYSASNKFVSAINLSNLPIFSPVSFEAFISAKALAISGSHVLFADSQGGLKSITIETDIAGKTAYVLKSSLNAKNAKDVTLSGTNAYIADYGLGLRIIDVSNPDAMSLTSKILTGQAVETAYAVQVHNNRAYIANNVDYVDVTLPSFSIFDLSQSPATILRNSAGAGVTFAANSIGAAYDLAIKEVGGKTYLFVAAGSSGLGIFDVTNAGKGSQGTTLVQQIRPITAFSLFIADDNLYVADRYNGFSVFNVSNPENTQWSHRIYWKSNQGGEFYHITEGEGYVAASLSFFESGIWTNQVIVMNKSELNIP